MIFIIQCNKTIYMQFTACLYIFYQETHLLKRRHLDVELCFQKLVMKVSFLHKEKHLKGMACNTVIEYLFFITEVFCNFCDWNCVHHFYWQRYGFCCFRLFTTLQMINIFLKFCNLFKYLFKIVFLPFQMFLYHRFHNPPNSCTFQVSIIK